MPAIILTTAFFIILSILFMACSGNKNIQENNDNHDNKFQILSMKEKQISFSSKNHALDNNDNFSPDNNFLCYDTRGTVYNDNIGNSKTIEKIEISTGIETVLYCPESVTGEQAAPGVGAVSWHPAGDKVIFIHGPLLDEVEKRGYYAITNRTGVEVSADGKGKITKVDLRDVATDGITTSGAQRGGTHRHEYARNGKRIGFTYNDFLNTNYDRTIGYMEANKLAPEGYTHFFALILNPAEKGKSKPGEIEKAYGDSWVDPAGKMRAFIGKVRAENGVDYQTDLFVADIPESVDITTAFSGNGIEYPEPPTGITIRRLTHSGKTEGIVRGSFDGEKIAFLSPDKSGILQVFVVNSFGSDLSEDKNMKPLQLSTFNSNANSPRWHPKKNWLFTVSDGNIAALCAEPGKNFGKTFMLTDDRQERGELVVSNDGNMLAYSILKSGSNKDETKKFRQIFVMEPDWNEILKSIK
jgi:Tol biopolymer transport system component